MVPRPPVRLRARRSIRGAAAAPPGRSVSRSCCQAGRRMFRPEAAPVKMRRWAASPLPPSAWETRMQPNTAGSMECLTPDLVDGPGRSLCNPVAACLESLPKRFQVGLVGPGFRLALVEAAFCIQAAGAGQGGKDHAELYSSASRGSLLIDAGMVIRFAGSSSGMGCLADSSAAIAKAAIAFSLSRTRGSFSALSPRGGLGLSVRFGPPGAGRPASFRRPCGPGLCPLLRAFLSRSWPPASAPGAL